MKIEPRPCDFSEYRTVLFPEQYEGDWRSFYNEADERTLALSRRVRSATQVMYGENPFQILDVFAPHEAADAPVMIFFHGGGFREGHPSHYGFLGERFVEKGAIFVSVGYRFEPDFQFPDYVDDGALALKWIFDNIANYGGSPRKLYLSGHSAGAVIIALLSLQNDWIRAHGGVPLDVVRGSVLVSGSYDFSITDPKYPDQNARPAELSAAHNIETAPGHVIVAYGSPEGQRIGQSRDFFEKQGRALARALREFECDPEVVVLPETNHLGTALALGDGGSPLHSAASAMMFS